MSIPKEKTILLKIKEIVDRVRYSSISTNYIKAVSEIQELIDSYEDRGYIGGPVVGEAEGGKEE
jgi:hypothetical protein